MNILKKTILMCLTLLSVTNISQAAPLKATVSILPQEYFVKKIGGELVEVNVMVRPGSSPATYEPQPRQMAELSKADIYFAIGVPFEKAWLPRFKAANNNLRITDLGDSVVRLPMDNHIHSDTEERHDMHNENTIPDPHIWLAPQLVRAISTAIRDSLIETDPANAATYKTNYLSFAKEINQLDSELITLFKAQQKTSFMVYHPSWGYFAQTYGLTQIPIEIEGKEPSPKELTQLIHFAQKNKVKAIFIQPQFSQKSAQAIASSVGAKVITADPLAQDWATNLKNTASAFIDELK